MADPTPTPRSETVAGIVAEIGARLFPFGALARGYLAELEEQTWWNAPLMDEHAARGFVLLWEDFQAFQDAALSYPEEPQTPAGRAFPGSPYPSDLWCHLRSRLAPLELMTDTLPEGPIEDTAMDDWPVCPAIALAYSEAVSALGGIHARLMAAEDRTRTMQPEEVTP